MIFVPLPFVVALLLSILFIRMLRMEEWSAPGRRLFLALIAAYAVQSVFIGLRWGYDMLAIMPLQAVLAAIVAPLSFASFADLTLGTPRPLGPLYDIAPQLGGQTQAALSAGASRHDVFSAFLADLSGASQPSRAQKAQRWLKN